jgi:hypothetical protein
MTYIECKNCCSTYSALLESCPTCNAQIDGVTNALFLLDELTRKEISSQGGHVLDVVIHPSRPDTLLFPCEWGLVAFHRKHGFQWTYFAPGLITDIKLASESVAINAGGKTEDVDLSTGLVRLFSAPHS